VTIEDLKATLGKRIGIDKKGNPVDMSKYSEEQVTGLAHANVQLKYRIAKLEAALRFYAEEKNWEDVRCDNPKLPNYVAYLINAPQDKGAIARKVLNEK
jgi:hypothetical protein